MPPPDDDFAAFARSHREAMEPSGPEEEALFEQFVTAAWELQRLDTLESEALAALDFDQLDRLSGQRAQHEDAFYRSLDELKDQQTAREIRERLANPKKLKVLPLADPTQVEKIGFVLSEAGDLPIQ
ncbi:MAG: hypothetical protein K2X03_03580 [Bryobacteraceae bacterium]|nr:hypothetical protein [Bryobacteraceae bacterium]